MNYHQLKKKNRPLSAVEKTGMTSMLSNLKKLRAQVTGKPCLTSVQSDTDDITTNPMAS